MGYNDQIFKIPQQADDYSECSKFVTSSIESIIRDAIRAEKNKIFINTNLKRGLPMENINKVAGPFVEAWAAEMFYDALEDKSNRYHLINVQAVERLHMADIILQFKKKRKVESGITAEIDVKATAEDIASSGKSPNITSYARIRTAYVEDPDYLFVILSLKHRVYSTRNEATGLMDGIMEVVAYNAYDLKFIGGQFLQRLVQDLAQFLRLQPILDCVPKKELNKPLVQGHALKLGDFVESRHVASTNRW